MMKGLARELGYRMLGPAISLAAVTGAPCQATTPLTSPGDHCADSSIVPDVSESVGRWNPVTSTDDLSLSSGGEGCGPPWLEWHDVAVWSSLMPFYHQRFGWDLRWGFSAVIGSRLSGTAMATFNERETRIYQRASLRWIVHEGQASSLHVAPFYKYGDGSRRLGLNVSAELVRTGSMTPWLRASLGMESQRYFRLRGWAVQKWHVGDLLRLQAGLAVRGRAPEGPIIRLLAAALRGSLWLDRWKDHAITWKVYTTCGLIASFGSFRVDAACANPRNLYQDRVDLTREGGFASVGPGDVTGNALLTVRTEAWRKLRAGLHVVAFSCAALLASDMRPLPVEAGLGIGLKSPSADMEAFKVRIDVPFYSTIRGVEEVKWDMRRLAIRVWLWPGVLEGLTDSDVKYTHQ